MDELPFNSMEVDAQDTVPPIAEALGGVISLITVATAVEVHALGPRTVRVYVPAALAVTVAPLEVTGPDHEKAAPVVVDAPVNTIEVVVQLINPPLVDALGGVMSPVTLVVAVAVQPLELLRTVTV